MWAVLSCALPRASTADPLTAADHSFATSDRVVALEAQVAKQQHILSSVYGITPDSLDALLSEQTGKAMLQSSYVHFHRWMFERGHLPLSAWGIERGVTQSNQLAKQEDVMDAAVLARAPFVQFVEEQRHLVAAGGRCLSWDGSHYLDRLPSCANSSWTFSFEADAVGAPSAARVVRSKQAGTLTGDLVSFADGRLLGPAASSFSTIVCNSVFEHIARPFEAAKALYNLLSPGGVLIWTAPFLERYHPFPGDYFRYTCDGARELLESAGLEVTDIRRMGDGLLATGYLLGFGTGDVPSASVRNSLRRWAPSECTKCDAASCCGTELYSHCSLVARKRST